MRSVEIVLALPIQRGFFAWRRSSFARVYGLRTSFCSHSSAIVNFSTMAPRQARISTRQLAIAAIVACVACSSVASGAKCWPKTATTTAPVATTDYPATTEEAVLTTDAPTQITTDAPETATDAPSAETPEVTQPTQVSGSTSVSSSTDGSSGPPTSESSTAGSSSTPTTQSSAAGSAGDSTTQGSASGAATFGDITSASGECVVGNPNAYISTKYVDWVWTNRMSKYVPDFKNYIFDQLVTNNGSLTYCVRWDSTNKLEKTMASKFEAMLNRQFKAWNEWLIGYDCWPFETIDVKIVGWATRDASLFDWSDDSLGTIYEGVKDADGVPQCPDDCYKHLNQATSSDTSACKGSPSIFFVRW